MISDIWLVSRLVMILLFMGVLLFIPAGTFDWPAAWAFILLYVVWAVPVGLWLRKNSPELLKQRLSFLKKPSKGWDKIVVYVGVLLFIAAFAVSGLDAVRYHWSQPPFALQVIAFAGVIFGYVMIFWVLRENTYASRIAEIQKGQKLITTGPYSHIRHPMYVGAIAYYLCIPLALGSLYGFIPSFVLAVLIIIRTHFEDRMLQKELEGYKEYAKKTRYRLIPGIW